MARTSFQYFFGGGAAHAPEAFRLALFTSTGGREGVADANSLKVAPLAVPGQGVRVLPGSGLILSRYGVADQQTYQAAFTEQVLVETTPTGSTPSTGRSDLVVLRVEDPYAVNSPWPAPPVGERADAQYIHVRVIPGVPAGTTRLQDVPGYQTDSAITLSRIDLPANTGTVTQAMITDLRTLPNPRELTMVRGFGLTAADGAQQLTDPTGITWPSAAAASNRLSLPIPAWATQMSIIMTVSGIKVPGAGQATGETWVQVGENGNANKVITQSTWWDIDETSGLHRVVAINPDTVAIPAALRGTTQRFYPRGRKSGGVDAKSYIADVGTSVALQVTFREVPV